MASNFLLNWVSDNVQAEAFWRGRAEAERLADRLADAAAGEGHSRAALEAVAGEPLPNFLYMAMEDAAVLEASQTSPLKK